MQKTVGDSLTKHVQMVMPEHINSSDRLFGGKLMQWVDMVAGVAARRHAGCEVTTAAIDNLHFIAPAFKDDILQLVGRVTHVGRTSMEVRVDTYAENNDSAPRLINTAFFVMVALTGKGAPCAVPQLLLQTDGEREEHAAAERRREMRKERRIQGF